VAAVDRVNAIRREIDELLASGVYEEQDPVVQALRADLAAAERRLAALRVRTSLT
jgi:Arc/MetJ-type ribon-helix-helix transcriptional regulator